MDDPKYSLDYFDQKINSFLDHKEYKWLRKEADNAKRNFSMCGLLEIIATDFIERIIAMPIEYIIDWLDKKNELKWRPCDEKMLKAIKGGYVHLLNKYDHHTIHHIGKGAAAFYHDCGYEIVTDGDNTYAIKEDEKCV